MQGGQAWDPPKTESTLIYEEPCVKLTKVDSATRPCSSRLQRDCEEVVTLGVPKGEAETSNGAPPEARWEVSDVGGKGKSPRPYFAAGLAILGSHQLLRTI
ncbi:unnamed protein product [Darwinula stevensoni]|uniref:Uncharacterized protein n=1 Tax=Darwinula stevensoni TaxID=69355 RepID=A0A7R8X8U6_9CRUS|nr:unnamed protein product [Darwinula stevensoni]CAG0890016.1 unnamed protein product [Darwinula stevensoni]